MELAIEGVYNTSQPKTEYLQLNVIEDTNLVHFLVSDTTYNQNGNVSNKHRHGYWFSKQEVKGGDTIRLYSGKGKSEVNNIMGFNNKEYVFYWGLDSCVWNNTGDGVLLFKVFPPKGKKVK